MNDRNPITFDMLRVERLKRGLTQQGVAARTGLDASTISRVETGRRPISGTDPRGMRAWAAVLGLDPSRLDLKTQRPAAPMRRMRDALGWTLPELGRRAGLDFRSLRMYDSASKPMESMAAGMADATARALDTTIERLCDRNDPKPAPPVPDDWDGTPLAWHRKRRGLSQQALAAAAGTYTQNIGQLERGERSPAGMRCGRLLAIAEALDVPARALLPRDV